MFKCFKYVLILSNLINFIYCVYYKSNDDQNQGGKPEPLNPTTIEYSKQFWKRLARQQKLNVIQLTRVQTQGIKARARNTATSWQYPVSDDGIRFLDTITTKLFPLGDPYSGLPEKYVIFQIY